ncbi:MULTISPECIES: metallophosphoesterase [Paenibacillus]|uniref:metallophosphoesterase n=1 Tax=Paenibacillus TaxID=44249 RepID=UPI0022B8E957|nr:metallophosphoesterase [Paenibacillus caseinilyticus]MCZ8522515.1 metallophosphoesterase [Paenibacillus caseinilyticus]
MAVTEQQPRPEPAKGAKRWPWVVLTAALLIAAVLAALTFGSSPRTWLTLPADSSSGYTLSLDEGDTVQGTKILLAAAPDTKTPPRLKIDGREVPVIPVMKRDAVMTFEAEGLQGAEGYRSSIWVNGQLVHTLDGTAEQFTRLTVPIPASALKEGVNEVILRSGSKGAPEETGGERDQWKFRGLTFTLADGTMLEDPDYKTSAVYTVGDPAPKKPEGDPVQKVLHFVVKEEKYRSVFYVWDTRAAAEGTHEVELRAARNWGFGPSRQVNVRVDNTPPNLEVVSPVDARIYKNKVSVSVRSADEGSADAPSLVAKLDGQVIEVPSVLETAGLRAGEHKLVVTASDKAGNETEKAVSFLVQDEMPYAPAAPMPADKAVVPGDAVQLSVQVGDAANDPLHVEFYKAERFDLSQPGLHTAYLHAADREPPPEKEPPGEKALTVTERSLVSAQDGAYLVSSDKERFPYHRFSFEVGDQLPVDSEIVWKGHSLPDRLVTLYAWNYGKSVWEDLASGKGTEDFTLRGRIVPAEMVREGRVEVLVQDRIPTPGEYDFAFVWMSDTQYYSETYPKIYDTMTRWTVDHWTQRKFSYLIHTGDIVNNWNSKKEWENADASMKILDDAKIPYGVLAGNHDVSYGGEYDEYGKYFGAERFRHQPTFGADLDNNREHYDLVSAKGHDFVILYLGWLIDQKGFDWANAVLKKYADRNAIIAVHEYLKPSKHYFGQGQSIWDKLVLPNPNVVMVLGGHNPGAAHNVKKVGDRTVLEMLSDYQNGPEGGQGFMRFLQFDLERERLLVNTFSPYLNKWNFFKPELDELEFPLKLKPIDKQVATDYIGVYARTNVMIGETDKVPSGSRAVVPYPGLQPGGTYAWYAAAKDEFGGVSKSDVWTFQAK